MRRGVVPQRFMRPEVNYIVAIRDVTDDSAQRSDDDLEKPLFR